MQEFKLYEEISNNGLTKIKKGKEYIDNWINNYEQDRRMGISLLIRPSEEIKEKIQSVLYEMEEIEPEQYYYPIEDIHVTLFDLITARQNFYYTNEQVDTFKKITRIVLADVNKFEINFDGIVASDGAIMVKGYYEQPMEYIRQMLRKEIIKNNLKIDERYTTRSSHITIARFSKHIKERDKLIKYIEQHKRYPFGKIKVSEIELIYHNWYDSKKEILNRYKIS